MALEHMDGRLNNFFIRKDFIENPVLTFNSTDIEEYWTHDRIESSKLFQYQVYEYASDLFRKKKLKSLLDLGSGPGTKAKLFFEGLAEKVTLADQPTTKPIAEKIFPSAEFLPLNIDEENISGNNKYDMIISSDVIEHLSNPDILLETIKRVLKDDGLVVLSTPERDFRRGKNCLQSPNKQHVREWNFSELRDYIEFMGFKVLEQRRMPLKRLFFPESIIHNLTKSWVIIRRETWFANQVLLISK